MNEVVEAISDPSILNKETAIKEIYESAGEAKLLGRARDNLLASTKDEKLKTIVDKLYREYAVVGSGSTADAVRYELRTGELLSPSGHSMKAQQNIVALTKRINSGELNSFDRSTAEHIIRDLLQALGGN